MALIMGLIFFYVSGAKDEEWLWQADLPATIA
jgi:hypothetical protein